MGNFTALNIEPGDQVDEEVDITKELQIEEALKLYQVALKLHSQGSEFYDEAAKAYDVLFETEIFKYPESISEFDRLENETEATLAANPDLVAPVLTDDVPSTLPQILYLAYKNRGLLAMERAHTDPKFAAAGLSDLSKAIVHDESDTELWRRIARVALAMGSKRIARYCLEAAVEVDDDPTVFEVEPPSVEEGLAGANLVDILRGLRDDVSLAHPILKPFLRKTLAPALLSALDPYPSLPDLSQLNIVTPPPKPQRLTIQVSTRSWLDLGEAIKDVWISETQVSNAWGVMIEIPDENGDYSDRNASHAESAEDQLMKDAEAPSSPIDKGNETITAGTPTEVDVTTTTTVPLKDERERSQSIGLPMRKRSQSAAGIGDTPEEDSGAPKRGKRTRNYQKGEKEREEQAELDARTIAKINLELEEKMAAAEAVFGCANLILYKLEVTDLGVLDDVKNAVSIERTQDDDEYKGNVSIRDLRHLLLNWDDAASSRFLDGKAAEIMGTMSGEPIGGITKFLELSKTRQLQSNDSPPFSHDEGLATFVQRVNDGWFCYEDIVYDWVIAVIRTYRTTQWPPSLNKLLLQVIGRADSIILPRIRTEIKFLIDSEDKTSLNIMTELAQTLFELHIVLDNFTQTSDDAELALMYREQLDRWMIFLVEIGESLEGEVQIRYFWAAYYYGTLEREGVPREHQIDSWSVAGAFLQEEGRPPIELPNNAVMPDISVAAAEREVTRLTTTDFFCNLFKPDKLDSVAIIETLEPVLDPVGARGNIEPEGSDPVKPYATTAAHDMLRKFLDNGSMSLEPHLWQRLRQAYNDIDYPTKVFSCHLKTIEVIMANLQSEGHTSLPAETRRHKWLVSLRALNELVIKSLQLALNEPTAFEIIDERHIRLTCATLAKLSRMLHYQTVFHDEEMLHQNTTGQKTNFCGENAIALASSFQKFDDLLRDMQIRTWALQYTLIRDAMTQHRDLFPTPDYDLAEFLATLHHSLGLRNSCSRSNRIFLKIMRLEMVRLNHLEKWEDFFAPVIWDLYGIWLNVEMKPNPNVLQNYPDYCHSVAQEPFDQHAAADISDRVITMANKMPMKDLLKHDLRSTIERIAETKAVSKPGYQHNQNEGILKEYIASTIRPIFLYQSLTGQFQLNLLAPLGDGLADKSWHFLRGMISLSSFRVQKRLGPATEDDRRDLTQGQKLMMLQLQFTPEHWEAWYRWAQLYDYALEDDISWSTAKLHNDKSDVVHNQRAAIHCYAMAISSAMRTADNTPETARKLSELYYDFGMRMYSSSRDPFQMKAFHVRDAQRFMSSQERGMYRQVKYTEMSRFQVWKYAAALFRLSLQDRPDNWMTHFMIGKCLWKMHMMAAAEVGACPRSKARPPMVEHILGAFVQAVKTAPERKDSRQEPVLEPHYKIVSMVNKLFKKELITMQTGFNTLQDLPYAPRRGDGEAAPATSESWNRYILEALRRLQAADKQHWHHRTIARVSKILFNGVSPSETHEAFVKEHVIAACNELRDSIFTKTMHIQVWRPDAERPGRHCVYINRYINLMISYLFLLEDKGNLEALSKRVRKREMEVFEFDSVWHHCCVKYLKLIRNSGHIPANADDIFKNVSVDGPLGFAAHSDRLTQWMGQSDSSHPALTALRESVELKKLNSNCMKATPIDDLINDSWAVLYSEIAMKLPVPLDLISGPPPPPPRPAGPMSLTNLVNMESNPPVQTNGQLGTNTFTPHLDPPRPPKLGVPRKEVLRQAELALQRADAPKATSAQQLASGNVAVIIHINGAPKDDLDGTLDETSHLKNGEMKDGDREESSAPGSVHDSADDESDLSDVPEMDDAEDSSIFPNLLKDHDINTETPP